MAAQSVTDEYLAEIVEAFNRQDLDAIEGYFAEDGVFLTGRGPAPSGHRIVGRREIREFLSRRFKQFSDWHWHTVRNWTGGQHGAAEWKITGTDANGVRFEWMGCDLFEFEKGLIKMKDTYWKGP